MEDEYADMCRRRILRHGGARGQAVGVTTATSLANAVAEEEDMYGPRMGADAQASHRKKGLPLGGGGGGGGGERQDEDTSTLSGEAGQNGDGDIDAPSRGSYLGDTRISHDIFLDATRGGGGVENPGMIGNGTVLPLTTLLLCARQTILAVRGCLVGLGFGV
jgi:hypothetical protein